MKRIVFAVCVLAGAGFQTLGQTKSLSLPKGAVVLETRQLSSTVHPNRSLVLWMLNPKKNPTSYAPDEVYSCPDYTRGSHYSGPTRVALVDSATKRILNTIKISGSYEEGGDSFDLPYAIRAGFYYRVAPQPRKGVEAKPTIMWLRDYNGDGKAFEFALFDAEACMGLQTTLIGYSEKQDLVIQYPVSLEVIEGSKRSSRMSPWADYLFSKKPLRPGYWKYEIDYRGRAGSLDKWEMRYNGARERFEGKLIVENAQSN
ncbi:MAG: hypothetical protein AABM67_16535 [Acidobacteriota bacterium]